MDSDQADRSRARQPGVVIHEERLDVRPEWTEAGTVRFRKDVDEQPVTEFVPRASEEATVERAPVREADGVDSGEVEYLDDGSISIPVLEEELVVTRRVVVRERLIVRKRTETHEEPVEATLRRERVEVETTGEARVAEERPADERTAQR